MNDEEEMMRKRMMRIMRKRRMKTMADKHNDNKDDNITTIKSTFSRGIPFEISHNLSLMYRAFSPKGCWCY